MIDNRFQPSLVWGPSTRFVFYINSSTITFRMHSVIGRVVDLMRFAVFFFFLKCWFFSFHCHAVWEKRFDRNSFRVMFDGKYEILFSIHNGRSIHINEFFFFFYSTFVFFWSIWSLKSTLKHHSYIIDETVLVSVEYLTSYYLTRIRVYIIKINIKF